jgi:predicted metalloenzyme YecM
MADRGAVTGLSERQREALTLALRHLSKDHAGTRIHYLDSRADWRRPARCEACARLLIEELLRG